MISEYDKAHVQEILNGHGDWFTAELLRLIGHADQSNRAKIGIAFPEEVEVYWAWFDGEESDPE